MPGACGVSLARCVTFHFDGTNRPKSNSRCGRTRTEPGHRHHVTACTPPHGVGVFLFAWPGLSSFTHPDPRCGTTSPTGAGCLLFLHAPAPEDALPPSGVGAPFRGGVEDGNEPRLGTPMVPTRDVLEVLSARPASVSRRSPAASQRSVLDAEESTDFMSPTRPLPQVCVPCWRVCGVYGVWPGACDVRRARPVKA